MNEVKFIAEICSNHNGDLDRALSLIEAAARAGCWGVKFQLFRIDSLFSPEILNHSDYSEKLNARRKWELPLEWLPDLKKRSQALGLKFGCTPFYLKAVDQLLLYVNFFKIASYELLWSDLIDRVMDTDKPVILSTGMATMREVKNAVWRQSRRNKDPHSRLTLLHCVSDYPVKPKDCYLRRISDFRTELNSIAGVGWSDHSVNPGVIYRAVHHHGAKVVEFHLDLPDRAGNEWKLDHCWTPPQIKAVIDNVNDGLMATGGQVENYPPYTPERDFRADPSDGLRPMIGKRRNL